MPQEILGYVLRLLWLLHFVVPGLVLVLVHEFLKMKFLRRYGSFKHKLLDFGDIEAIVFVGIMLLFLVFWAGAAYPGASEVALTYFYGVVIANLVFSRPVEWFINRLWPLPQQASPPPST